MVWMTQACSTHGVLPVSSLQRRKHRSFLGGVLAPSISPATTIIITDILDSTVLWWVAVADYGNVDLWRLVQPRIYCN
jgi:hypothetical protein